MIKAVLIDLSGTLHIENQAISGCVEALKRLREKELYIKFVTNTTKESKRILHQRLTQLGFDVNKEDILSSLTAARNLIDQRNLKPMLMLEQAALEDFEGIACPSTDTPNAVIVGLAPTEFHYEKLNEAFRHLQAGAQLIAIHAGKYYKRSDGLALGPGFFVKGLEYSAECTAEVVGKPNSSFFLSALGSQNKPEEAIMIGDDVNDDIQGAMKAGLRGYLVQTGKYKVGDEGKISPPPSAVFPSFVEAVENILTQVE
ncbi:haloacid dehalogenase-like hydrolase domain-containing protein 2 [Diorhabda sublineata]|uniref:haloacid dehalogenase-like hydrolase domain-containing protein 2 n=1 Tax=Diorhabda sublineata TaxID=1163346 RepID=UPI0024E1129B|nr:haloacid dehalogenase-like hydrolase domain-containing protein 2 [Diorhabda sublineata]